MKIANGLLLLITVLAGCSAGTPEPEPAASPFLKDVTYKFNEQPAGTDRTIVGTVRVLGNTVVFDAQPGPCRSLPRTSDRTSAFQCAEVLLVADMTTPVFRVTYHTSKTVRETKSTCVLYEVNAAGQRVCKQTQTDVVERGVPVSGQLRLIAEP